MPSPKNSSIPFEFSDYVLRKSFTDAGKIQGWIDSAHVIAAVSGGGDSIALLWLCSKFFAGKVTALHINHGIRGQESDGDEEFTAKFAQSLGCEFVSVRVSVPESRQKGESLESAARRLRHEGICSSAKTLGVNTVLLGHNRDDLAETVMFNILRGTGIRGAVGITEFSELDGVRFCRPLLEFRREFLREILRVRGLTWREDSTNNDDAYTRNYIRLKLLPAIEQNINASAVEHLARFGEDMRPVREREDELSAKLFTECREGESQTQAHENSLVSLNAKKLRRLSADEIALVIREAGRRLSLRTLARKRCDELVGLIQNRGGFVFQWCGDVTITAKNGRITINKNG